MPIANLSQKIAEISEELENLRAQSLSHPDKVAELLQDGLYQVQVSLKELTDSVDGIAEAKRDEEALRESEARLRQIAKAGRIGLFEWNASKDTAYWSPEHYELFGFEPGSTVSWQRWLQGVHPEDRERVMANALQLLERARSEGGVSGHKDEYRFIRPDGSVVWIEANLSVDMVGGETIVRGSVRDITERKQAEEALIKSEKQLKHIIENSMDVAYRRDLLTDRFDYISPVIENITGFSIDEMMAMSADDMVDRVHPDDLDIVYKKFEMTLKGSHCVIEYRFRCKDGNYRWIADSINILTDSHGNPIYRVGVVRDITERKRAEESEERLRVLMDHNPSLVFLKDESGRYVYLNKAYERQFALSKDWYGKTDFNFWPKESAELFRMNDSDVLKSGQIHQFLEDSTDLEGIRHCWLCYKFPFVDSKNERYVGGIGIDATDRIQAEEALGLAYARLQTFFDHRIGGIGIVIANAKGSILQANDYYLNILGCSRDELLSGQVDWRKITPPEWLPADERALAQLHERGVCDPYEKEYIRRNGTRVPVLITDAMMPGDSGDILAFIWDITDRKHAEKALIALEEKTRNLLKRAPTGIYEIDFHGPRFLMVNDFVCEATGYIREELLEMSPFDLLTDESKVLFQDRIRRQLAGEKVDDTVEYRGKVKDGREMFWVLKVTFTYDAEGQPVGAIVVGEDITERKLAEEALHETKDYLEKLIDYANAPIIVWDPSLRITRFNHAFERLTGLRAVEALGEHLKILFPESCREASLEKIHRAMSGERWESVEIPIMKIDGSVRIVLWNSANVYGKDGTAVIATIAQGQDVTERKQVEKALRESEQRFRLALRNAPVSVSAQDRDLRFIWAYNQRSARPEEIIGKFDADIFTPEEAAHLVAIKRRVLDENVEVCEQMWLDRPGGRMFLDVTFEPIRDETGRAIGVATATIDLTPIKLAEEALSKSKDELEQRVQERTEELSQANKRLEAVNINLIDEIKNHTKAKVELLTAKEALEITNEELQSEIEEHKQTEKQLLEAKDAAEAAARAKAEFLANMSHEIRTPMNSVIGFTQLLLDEPLDPMQRENLELIRTNGDALLTIINDILDFSKMESDKVILEKYQFRVRQCVEESLDLVAIKAAEKGLNLAYTIDKNVPDTIIGDFSRLRQILGNLLSNAVKFTDEGEVTVSVSVDETNQIHFAVRDTGIGIPRERIDQLFQPFNQMEPSTTRLYGGTGLGLVISKKLVELMGGQIWAKSSEGIGSTFHFTIKASSGQVEPATVSPQLIGKSVLIIEDNKTNRRILNRQVYDWGMIPMAASSGQEALSYVQRGDNFDIAILDMDLRTMDSFELEGEIRKYNKTLPLVLLASLGKRIPPNHAYLTKPIKPSQLYKVLTDILPMQPAQRPIKTFDVNQPLQNNPLRILLAEDNVSSQKVAQQMLKKMGYRVDVVANGMEVLQSLERQHYDVVFMDVKMPEMDGLETTRIIRQRWPDNGLKIIAITAYALKGDRERFIEAGMDDYLAKPVQKAELAEVLKKYSLKAQ